ncbi:hypothetical protein ACFSUK_31600 [Sphingobium scionense]
MPHVGLSDTSALDNWVTDSAAGMSAIMTGHKTNSGMISALPAPMGRSPRSRASWNMPSSAAFRPAS